MHHINSKHGWRNNLVHITATQAYSYLKEMAISHTTPTYNDLQKANVHYSDTKINQRQKTTPKKSRLKMTNESLPMTGIGECRQNMHATLVVTQPHPRGNRRVLETVGKSIPQRIFLEPLKPK